MKVERLLGMIVILLDKGRVGAQEMADLFEVSPRTVYRDIDAINMAGIPVRSIPGVGGGFEIMPGYKMDKKVFSTAELSTLLMGLSGLSGLMQGEELTNALAKVKSFIPADSAREIELRANQIRVDLSPWTGTRNIQPYLTLIKTALQESRLLTFAYADQHGNKTIRTVEPYQLVLKGSHWYFQGYCRIRNDYRLFKLSRMSSLEIQAETFTPREYQKPILNFGNSLDAVQAKIKLRIHKSVMDRVLDFCPYEDFVPDGAEYYIVNFPFTQNDYNYDMLLGFGDRCECLEPSYIRAEMKRRIEKIAALYGDRHNEEVK